MCKFISLMSGLLCFFFLPNGFSQLYVNGGSIFLDSGSSVHIKGDLISTQPLTGSGKVIMSGSTGQYLHTNGLEISTLEIDNPLDVTLNSDLNIQRELNFVTGRIITGNNHVTFSAQAICSGMGPGKLIDVSGGGMVFKLLQSNVSNTPIPIGLGASYNPVFITTQATDFQNASIGIRAVALKHPELPVGSTDYLKVYWPITRNGITGSVTVSGQYNNTSDVMGTKTNLIGAYYDDNQWSSLGETHDASTNRLGMMVSSSQGVLTGINQGSLANIKALLQGYYLGSHMMQPTLYDLGVNNIANATDSVFINFWSPSFLSQPTPNFSFKALMHQQGIATVNVPSPALGQVYYLAIKHRNSVETWSALPLTLSNNLTYDFTTGIDKAYADGVNPSMKQMSDGTYALYAGDVNQDGTIDVQDMLPTENDASDFLFGYQATDCTGDGVTDASDMNYIENNASLFIFFARPY